MEYCYVKNESQYGLLLLQRYLYEHTDDQHPASVADILAFFVEYVRSLNHIVAIFIYVSQIVVLLYILAKSVVVVIAKHHSRPRIDTSWAKGFLNCRS